VITITKKAARTVLRLLEDVRDADQRARCSDAYFRQHFMTLARLPAVADAAAEVAAALEAADAPEPPDPFDDPDE
jgi:hypothetical protein